MNKKSFVLYNDYYKHIIKLSDEDAGQLFKAILASANNEEIPELSPIADITFSFISEQLIRDTSKWENICKKRSEAGKKGGRPKTEKANQKQTKAKKADNDTVNVNDTVTDNDTVNDIPDRCEKLSGEEKQSSADAEPEQKKSYGSYGNIVLSESEYRKLCQTYGNNNVNECIERMDSWIQAKGKSPYKDFPAAVRQWLEKDGKAPRSSSDIEKYKFVINKF